MIGKVRDSVGPNGGLGNGTQLMWRPYLQVLLINECFTFAGN